MNHTQFLKTLLAITAVLGLLSVGAWGSTYKVLYNFTGGNDGLSPVDAGNLAIDDQGNLYGTTQFGGDCGAGTLFELSPNGSGGWTETVLHSFCGQDGAGPTAAPILGSGCCGFPNPTVVGTTVYGGDHGEGVEYIWLGPGFYSIYYAVAINGSFDCSNPFFGCFPYATPSSASGFGYTATYGGGANSRGVLNFTSPNPNVLSSSYEFCSLPGCADGANPGSAVAIDSQGSGYGTTLLGGASHKGVVYECAIQWDGCAYSVLHSFAGGTNDGAYPFLASLTLTQACGPNLCNQTIWGTTPLGGAGAAHGGPGYGTIFQITTFFGFKLAHSFNLLDGANPYAGLTNLNGTFYGTTAGGGFLGVRRITLGRGTIYSLTSSGTLTTLHTFAGPDGATPYSGLVADSNGNLYGVTFAGGAYGAGVVYEITP